MKCKKCLFCFVARKKRKQEYLPRNKEKLFEKYITAGYSSNQLADQKELNEDRIRQHIQSRLDQNPITCISEIYPDVHHIMIDGYWLPKSKYGPKRILLVYYAYMTQKVIWFSIRDGEKKEYIAEDLKFLRDHMGYTDIISCTVDGGVGIAAAFKEVYPAAVLQRCLVHVQRQVKNYISMNPKSQAGRDLRRLMVYDILSDSLVFPCLWRDWKTNHQPYINEKTIKPSGGWRYTHTKLKKAIAHIDNALSDMFQFHQLNIPEIARSSNQLEGYFGVFAEEGIKEHKGLSPKRLDSFIALWITFRNQK